MSNQVFEIVQAMSGQGNCITIPGPYLDFFAGDRQQHLLAAILNQLVFWSGKSSLENGWFYKEHAALAKEIRAKDGDVALDPVAFERDKIKGAIRTDFVLSAEIIAITLGTVANAAFGTRVAVLVGIALLMTVGVYGFVAGIVKLDDAGLHLSRSAGAQAWAGFKRALGRGILRAAPWLMKALSVAGTAAMFLVGGGILTHGVPWLHHGIETAAGAVANAPALGGVLAALAPSLANALVGVVAGALVLLGVSMVGKMRRAA